MNKWVFLFLLSILLASCNSIWSAKPVGTLSESEMSDLLVDIHLTEATLRIANDSISRLNDTIGIRNRFAQVFIKHDVDPDDFNKSLNYYIEHIEDLDKIYVEVIARLTSLEASLQPSTSPSASTQLGPVLQELEDYKMFQTNNPWFIPLHKHGNAVEIKYFAPELYRK
jgi:hypothetical protein